MNNALELRGLTKRYPDFTLDGLDLTLPSGCVMGLVGENGAALDALATAALILGPEQSMPLLRAQSIDAVFVTEQGQVLITRDLKNEFRLTNKTNTMSDGQVSVA